MTAEAQKVPNKLRRLLAKHPTAYVLHIQNQAWENLTARQLRPPCINGCVRPVFRAAHSAERKSAEAKARLTSLALQRKAQGRPALPLVLVDVCTHCQCVRGIEVLPADEAAAST